jgi:hypothetical protein
MSDDVVVALATLEEIQAKAENYDRLKRILRRYVAEHAGKYSPPGCSCPFCTEAEPFLEE